MHDDVLAWVLDALLGALQPELLLHVLERLAVVVADAVAVMRVAATLAADRSAERGDEVGLVARAVLGHAAKLVAEVGAERDLVLVDAVCLEKIYYFRTFLLSWLKPSLRCPFPI